MGVRRLEDLVAWQLAAELESEVFALTATGPASIDFDFRDQIRRATASATRNTAEGFGRFRPREFARFLSYAHGSLDETKDCLHTARRRGYLSEVAIDRLLRLVHRALGANAKLATYLRNCPPDGFIDAGPAIEPDH